MVGSIHDMDFLSPCIYLITSPSNKIYIGQTIDINKRLKDYRNYKGVKFQNKLFHSFNKYGYENHIINILLWCKDRKELNFWEKFYVKLFNTYQSEYGLNLTSGGDSKYEVSDSTKEKLRIANIGKKQSEETKQKKREISIKNGNKPPKMIWTEERRKKWSELSKGQKNGNYGKGMKAHLKEILLKVNVGKIASEETRKKLSLRKKNINKSEETKLKISKSNLGVSRKKIKIIDIKTNEIYQTAKECSIKNDIRLGRLKKMLRGDAENNTYLRLYNG